MKNCIMALIILGVIKNCFSAEVDNFYGQDIAVKDSSKVLNQKANEFLQYALDRTNTSLMRKRKGCQSHPEVAEKKLFKNLRKMFNNHIFGDYNKWIEKSEELHKVSVPFKDSIFNVFSIKDSFVLKGLKPVIGLFGDSTLTPYLRVGDHRIGIDKIEHFMGTGYRYYDSFFVKNRSMAKTAAIGWKDETGILGAGSNGVMSYGDLAAEFNGMFFWAHILRKYDSFMNRRHKKNLISRMYFSQEPYVICREEKWVANPKSRIDWNNYFDDSMDESINCSRYRTQKMANKIKKGLALKGQICPLSLRKFYRIHLKYGNYGKFFINYFGPTGIKNLKRPF